MSDETTGRLIPEPGEIKIRLYGQGLGDCFLLAFPPKAKGDRPCYLVIDCGVAKSTPDKDLRIRQVVADIRRATGGRIDALAITHQHYDHLSGFLDAWQEWKTIAVEALYLPWTETTAATGEHGGTAEFRRMLDEAAKKAIERMAREEGLDSHPGLRAHADFLGLGLDAARNGGPADMDEAMAFARGLVAAGTIRYFQPGDVFRLPRTEFHGYVLGPPLPDKKDARGKKYVELLVDGSDGVMYSYADFRLKVDTGKPGGANAFAVSDNRGLPALASSLLAAGSPLRDSDEGFCPFASEIRLDWDNAMSSPFFQSHYGNVKEGGENGRWRRVDFDWLASGASLALRAGDFTNNVSLVLAFDNPKSDKMLLFPGDAQVGNWLSWHTIKTWNYLDTKPAKPPAEQKNGNGKTQQTLMENLLSRVAFYKVGHHGSHNATIKDKGLEKMTRDDLVAYIPVSVPVAQDLMGYCPMPFYPVVRALQNRTNGCVFLPNGKAVGKLDASENDENDALLARAGIVPATETLPALTKDGVELEAKVPLYLEVTVAK